MRKNNLYLIFADIDTFRSDQSEASVHKMLGQILPLIQGLLEFAPTNSVKFCPVTWKDIGSALEISQKLRRLLKTYALEHVFDSLSCEGGHVFIDLNHIHATLIPNPKKENHMKKIKEKIYTMLPTEFFYPLLMKRQTSIVFALKSPYIQALTEDSIQKVLLKGKEDVCRALMHYPSSKSLSVHIIENRYLKISPPLGHEQAVESFLSHYESNYIPFASVFLGQSFRGIAGKKKFEMCLKNSPGTLSFR